MTDQKRLVWEGIKVLSDVVCAVLASTQASQVVVVIHHDQVALSQDFDCAEEVADLIGYLISVAIRGHTSMVIVFIVELLLLEPCQSS